MTPEREKEIREALTHYKEPYEFHWALLATKELLAEIDALREENKKLSGELSHLHHNNYPTCLEDRLRESGIQNIAVRKENADLRERLTKLETAANDMLDNERLMRHHGQIKDTLAFDECREAHRLAKNALREALKEDA